MFKTVLAGLIISPVIAYIIHGMFMYPILRIAVTYAFACVLFVVAMAWALDHIHSLFKNKS